MVCKKRLSCSRYDSFSGHDFIIGCISKRYIGVVIYARACQQFDAEYKRVEESEEHYCPNNFERSYKSMESDAIINIVEDAFYHHCFTIDFIVSDDDKKF